jgi:chromosomal replication initiator protein
MRTAVLRKRAQQDGIDVPDPAILDIIAGRIEGSVRELEGGLIRVVAFASLTGRPLTVALADEVLAGLYPRAIARAGTSPARPTVGLIKELVCEHFSLTR